LRELSRIARNVNPDLLHCTHISTPRPKVAVPLVTTLHDLTPLIIEGTMPSKLKQRVYRGLNKRAVKNSAALITPSTHTANDVESFFPAAAGKIHVVPEAADDFTHEAKQIIPQLVTQLPPTPFFLSMGNTKPHKNLPILLKAYDAYCTAVVQQQLCDPELTPRLFLVGKGDSAYLDAHLSAAARDKVFFTGATDDSQLRWFYAHAHTFIFPSLYEGFGLPLLEAASFGIPVVAAKASSLPEVMGEAAAYFDPNDASALTELLMRVSRDQAFIDDMATRAFTQSQQFSWTKTAKKTLEVYRGLL
jgi:glycosyltransferase involved in cell wall biosynthesis